MMPQLLLSLWRSRWHLPDDAGRALPYLEGSAVGWAQSAGDAAVFRSWPSRLLISAGCLGLLALCATIQYALHDQLLVAGLLIVVALVLRRYQGPAVTWVLVALWLLASVRYLTWRLMDSLPWPHDPGYWLAFALWAAEAYFVLLWALDAFGASLPLRRAAVPLPADKAHWPSVDVLILAHGHEADEVGQALHRARTLSWPQERLHLHVLDTRWRAELAALCTDATSYHAPATGDSSLMASLTAVLKQPGAELVIVVDSATSMDKDWLPSLAGWFAADPRLGLITTPQHPLAPALSRAARRLFAGSAMPVQVACLRRLALAGNDLSGAHLLAEPAGLAAELQARQYKVAYVESDAVPEDDQTTGDTADAATPSSATLWLVEPARSATMRWGRHFLQSLDGLLRRCAVLPRLVFFAAPSVYLVLNIELCATTVDVLAAFALPHLLHAYIVRARLAQPLRQPLATEVRELLLACYLLIPTAINVARTCSANLWRRLHPAMRSGPTVSEAFNLGPFAVLVLANLAGLLAGGFDLLSAPAPVRDITGLGVVWCAVNLLLLASTLAIAAEAAHIRDYLRRRAVLPAMLRLPYGRTVSCATENFPAVDLGLRLPAATSLAPGTPLTVTLFFEQRAYPFAARVLSGTGSQLSLRLADKALADYATLRNVVLSRGQDWPAWLPGRDAHRLLPASLAQPIVKTSSAVLHFFTHLSRHASRLSPYGRRRSRTRTND
ncbi:hypothetical protein [Noviherbaspirillum malthae]|uniref:hypothetical protein n=1 Tax=Noviherbaspirillum malthae TaxID=1260987 RepID=UPI0018902A61|nr:hypothetical protein [Noviherbaspirillum malthae]